VDDLNTVVASGEVFGETGGIISASVINEKNFGISSGELELDSSECGMMMLRWAPTPWSLSDPRCGVSSSGSRWWSRLLFWGLPG